MGGKDENKRVASLKSERIHLNFISGTSFVNGICSDSRSTSLVVDHGAYTSAGIGTHELGHK